MGRLRGFSQFCHVPEDGDAPAFRRQVPERLKGGEHGIGIRIVGVVEHADPILLPKLETHFRPFRRGQSAPKFLRFQTQPRAHSQRQ